jgi:hypothetical protein
VVGVRLLGPVSVVEVDVRLEVRIEGREHRQHAVAGRCPGPLIDERRQSAVVSVLVVVFGEGELFQVVSATHASGRLAEVGDAGQEQPAEHGRDEQADDDLDTG